MRGPETSRERCERHAISGLAAFVNSMGGLYIAYVGGFYSSARDLWGPCEPFDPRRGEELEDDGFVNDSRLSGSEV